MEISSRLADGQMVWFNYLSNIFYIGSMSMTFVFPAQHYKWQMGRSNTNVFEKERKKLLWLETLILFWVIFKLFEFDVLLYKNPINLCFLTVFSACHWSAFGEYIVFTSASWAAWWFCGCTTFSRYECVELHEYGAGVLGSLLGQIQQKETLLLLCRGYKWSLQVHILLSNSSLMTIWGVYDPR